VSLDTVIALHRGRRDGLAPELRRFTQPDE
jgi:hypothetical protein